MNQQRWFLISDVVKVKDITYFGKILIEDLKQGNCVTNISMIVFIKLYE